MTRALWCLQNKRKAFIGFLGLVLGPAPSAEEEAAACPVAAAAAETVALEERS